MPLIENIKKAAETVTGIGRPARGEVHHWIRKRKPNAYRFADDGATPNNRALPLIYYRSPVRLDGRFDPAAIFEELFAAHGWKSSWRDGIYPHLHFHTHSHEVLGIARGHARVQLGGARGRRFWLKAGDVVILPAGTGHRRLGASADLLVVGAYPANGGGYDEPRPEDVPHEEAMESIAGVALPAQDPVYGRDGPLVRLWRAKRGH
jgi:uncharacterized protein YjlB